MSAFDSGIGYAMAIGALWAENEGTAKGTRHFIDNLHNVNALSQFATGPVVDAAKTITDFKANPEKKGTEFAEGAALAPLTGLGTVAKVLDYGHDRQAKTFEEKAKAKIPGLRETLPRK